MDKNHPLDKRDEKSFRVAPEQETDSFGEEEQKKIVNMVRVAAESDLRQMEEFFVQRAKDIQMYNGEKPSVIENLDKEDWQSDRNLRICTATCDAYQATLLATCFNADRIHWKATESGDVNRSENLEKFTVWAIGPQEADILNDVDDFIHNKITQGTSYFKIGWKVWYKWVDRRIPQYDKGFLGLGRQPKFKGYKIETEHKRFERGYIENIDDIAHLLYPTEGDNLQTKHHLIHVIPMSAAKIVEYGESGVFINVDEDYKKKIKKYCYDNRTKVIKDEKLKELGLLTSDDISDEMLNNFTLEIHEYYGEYEKNGKKEEYRLTIDPNTNTFLAGKPLRKINRKAKRPFVGGALIRRPGFVQGTSIPTLISDPCNAFNNIYNQKSDFQYVQNCPYGFYDPDDPLAKNVYELRPGRMFPSSNPQSINFPNNTRSVAWAMDDFNILIQMIEKLTGAASYFSSNRENVSGTATRDKIVAQNSDTRFGLFVNRIISEISEAITMFIEQYQDWAPPGLSERVLGEDGKQLFNNFSIETIMGNYDAFISPDIISGSKALEREIALWGIEALSQTVWFNPQINPKGNWELVARAGKKMGIEDIETMMPPKPQAEWSQTEIVKKRWNELKQGIIPTIEPGDDVQALFMGFTDLKETKYYELDKEYQPNFDNYYMALGVAMFNLVRQQQQEVMVNSLAMSMINERLDANKQPLKPVNAPMQMQEDLGNDEVGQ